MASRSLNRVVLIGNLTRDPELKYIPQGTAVCTFGVATNRNWTTVTGEVKEDVQFHRIVAWQKLAELCGKILAKGRKVYLEGRLTYRTFTGKDGLQRTIAEIVLDDFVVFDSQRRTEASGQPAAIPVASSPQEKTEEAPVVSEAGPAETPESSDNSGKVEPEDIPF